MNQLINPSAKYYKTLHSNIFKFALIHLYNLYLATVVSNIYAKWELNFSEVLFGRYVQCLYIHTDTNNGCNTFLSASNMIYESDVKTTDFEWIA